MQILGLVLRLVAFERSLVEEELAAMNGSMQWRR